MDKGQEMAHVDLWTLTDVMSAANIPIVPANANTLVPCIIVKATAARQLTKFVYMQVRIPLVLSVFSVTMVRIPDVM